MSLLYPDPADVQYTVTVTFLDDTSVPIEGLKQEHAVQQFQRYVRDAKEHANDGLAFTAKRVTLSCDGGKFGTDEILDEWARDDDSDGLPAYDVGYNAEERLG